MKKTLFYLLLFLSISSTGSANNSISVNQDMFIEQMVAEHGFTNTDLEKLFDQATVSKSILAAISKPAEKKLKWFEYKDIFLQEKRINKGVEFWRDNSHALLRAEIKFGVPAEIIVAIIGVETFYGRIKGSYRVVDALNTLAFHYPKRADFFRSEFKHFLLLSREQGFEPLSLTGSYAGAMGLPQFISSSYRNYAIDFDGDDIINIWDNPVDAIGSVANYFVAHRWRQGEEVIHRVDVEGDTFRDALTPGLKPDLDSSELETLGIKSDNAYATDEKLKLLQFVQESGPEYWLARHNFYVITRYNHSQLYAMAVYQLAQEIKQRKNNLAQQLEQ